MRQSDQVVCVVERIEPIDARVRQLCLEEGAPAVPDLARRRRTVRRLGPDPDHACLRTDGVVHPARIGGHPARLRLLGHNGVGGENEQRDEEEVEDDGDSFEEKMPRLVAELHVQFAESAKLEEAIKANLRMLGFK